MDLLHIIAVRLKPDPGIQSGIYRTADGQDQTLARNNVCFRPGLTKWKGIDEPFSSLDRMQEQFQRFVGFVEQWIWPACINRIAVYCLQHDCSHQTEECRCRRISLKDRKIIMDGRTFDNAC